ncbi:unnamed protein product [Tilletia controversa]|nr:unnamed protein product [Tilletia controversa]CAD6932210.1 unnamed protein product [Tilletia controversa]CAD6938610.1 unnamed protein product [Tilletia caries]
MVVHLLVRRSSVPDGERIPFETLLFDTVEQTWSENHRTSPIGWCRRDLEEIEQPAQVYKLEEDLYSKVKEIVPALLEGRNCPGAQLFAKLETEFGTDKIHAILIGDIFQDIMAPCLPVLSPENCKGVPRIELSAIVSYVACWVDHVWLVDIVLPSSGTPIRAVLKTLRPPEDGQLSDAGDELSHSSVREATVLTSLPPHPNVMPAPLALVTLKCSGDRTSSPIASEKLIGVVLPYFSGGPYYEVGRTSDEDLKRRLRHAYEFASAVAHVNRHGFYVGDLGQHNIVLSAPPPNDRIVLIDFELPPSWMAVAGEPAPEVKGEWVASMQNNQLVYSRCENPVWKGDTIRTELANLPEALERLEIFGVGHSLSVMVQCPVYFSWLQSFSRPWIRRTGPEVPRQTSNKAWESRIPKDFTDLVQRCCSFDPRDRPLHEEIVAKLKQWA